MNLRHIKDIVFGDRVRRPPSVRVSFAFNGIKNGDPSQ